MSVKTSDFNLGLTRRRNDFIKSEDMHGRKLSEADREKLRALMADSVISVQELFMNLKFIASLSPDSGILVPDKNGNLNIPNDKLTLYELKDLLAEVIVEIKNQEDDNKNLLSSAYKKELVNENILPSTGLDSHRVMKSSPPTGLQKNLGSDPVIQHNWSELELGINSGSASILWISQQIAVMLIDSNTQAAKIAADTSNLLNRVLSEISAVSQFLTTLSSIYTEALNVKQTNQLKDANNQGITSSTITFDELIENNLPPNSGDETPDLTFATYTDKKGNVRQGFLMKDVPEIMKSLMGLNGGSFNYLDWNGFYIQNKDGEWVKDGTMNDAPKNNITNQGAIDALANKVKQVQNLLSSVTQQVSIYQGNSQSATTPFNTVLAMMNQILNMLGA